jgi:hypothetical protein
MHLVPRENLPESTNGDQKRKHKHSHEGVAADPTQRTISPTAGSNTTTPGCCDACSIL